MIFPLFFVWHNTYKNVHDQSQLSSYFLPYEAGYGGKIDDPIARIVLSDCAGKQVNVRSCPRTVFTITHKWNMHHCSIILD